MCLDRPYKKKKNNNQKQSSETAEIEINTESTCGEWATGEKPK